MHMLHINEIKTRLNRIAGHTTFLIEEVHVMERVINEIDGMIRFYKIGMDNAKLSKNNEKYYQFEEAYEALQILKTRIAGFKGVA